VAFSVTTQGSQTVLATFQNGYNFPSLLVSGPNGRLYSTIEPGSALANVFSVPMVPGSVHGYPAQTITPELTQNLPDGMLLGLGPDGSYVWHIVQCDLQGVVTSIAPVASNLILENAIYASDGNYYAVAEAMVPGPPGAGYVLRVTPAGSVTTLYTFPNYTFTGGTYTWAPLLQASDGNLYGGTATGGANGTGTIYRLTLGGQFTLLYSFGKSKYPRNIQNLVEASDGNLYGATETSDGGGLLFRVSKSGQYAVVYNMTSPTGDGLCPCWLVQGSDGIIYGIAHAGGSIGDGAVFALDAGLAKPTPSTQSFFPHSGSVGTNVRIWGSNLLSASVEFNGIAASTVSNSGSDYVFATVPAEATTGPITVTTPGGSITTKASFTMQ
jgi:uncharacterized repeat protein (TIGR03803 family)